MEDGTTVTVETELNRYIYVPFTRGREERVGRVSARVIAADGEGISFLLPETFPFFDIFISSRIFPSLFFSNYILCLLRNRERIF